MNFHISPLSPLRPRYPTTLPGPSEHKHNHHNKYNNNNNINNHQREPDDDDQDDGTDHYHLHLRPPRTPVGRSPLGRPRIEVDEPVASDTSSSSSSGPDSSGSDSDSDSDLDLDSDHVAQDSRDVLAQRLNDLAQRLGAAAHVRAADVEALHAQVDEMERVLSRRGGNGNGNSSSRRRRQHHHRARNTTRHAADGRRDSSLQPPGPRGSKSSGNSNGDAHGLMGPPLNPSWLLSRFQRQPSVSIRRGQEEEQEQHGEKGRVNGSADRTSGVYPPPLPSVGQQGPLAAVVAAATASAGGEGSSSSSRESYEMADTIVQEAEGLCAEMASVIASLQKRREESDHLHAVLVQREGAAHKLIRDQAARIGRLEAAVAGDEAELRYLKIQLRALEARCLGYVPEGADPELDRSIRSWKRDWTDLRDAWAERAAGGDDGSSSFTGSSSTTGPAGV